MAGAEGVLIRALAGGRTVRVLAVDLATVADKARRAHGLSASAAVLAAQGVVATALLSAHVKGEERLSLQLQGSRPRMAFIGEIDGEGDLRARMTPADAATGPGGRLDGVLLALKSIPGRELYRGHTAVEDQTLEEALAAHLSASEQVPAVLRILVELSADGTVQAAGGFLVERLPEHRGASHLDPEAFDARYGGLAGAPGLAALADIGTGALLGEPLDVLERREVRWRCRCSEERVAMALTSLGQDELRDMIEEDHGAEVTCHFCNTVYVLGEDQLRQVLAAVVG